MLDVGGSDMVDAFDGLALLDMQSPGLAAPSVDDLIRRSLALNTDDGDKELLALGADHDLLLTSHPDMWMAARRDGGGLGGPTAGPAAATNDARLLSPGAVADTPVQQGSDWLSAPAAFGGAFQQSFPTPAQVLAAAAAAAGGAAAGSSSCEMAIRFDKLFGSAPPPPCISGPAAPLQTGAVRAAAMNNAGGHVLLQAGTAAAGGARFSSDASIADDIRRTSSSSQFQQQQQQRQLLLSMQQPMQQPTPSLPQLPAEVGGELQLPLLHRPPPPRCTAAPPLAEEWRSGGHDQFMLSAEVGGAAMDSYYLDWAGGSCCSAAMPPRPPPVPPLGDYSSSGGAGGSLQLSPWSTGGALQAAERSRGGLASLPALGGRSAHAQQQGSQWQWPAQALSAGAVTAPGFSSGVSTPALCSSAVTEPCNVAVGQQLRTRKHKRAHAIEDRLLPEPEPTGILASGTYELGPDGEPPVEYRRPFLLQQQQPPPQLEPLPLPPHPLQLPRHQSQAAQSPPQLLQLPLLDPAELTCWLHPPAPAAALMEVASVGAVAVKSETLEAAAADDPTFTGVCGAAQRHAAMHAAAQQQQEEEMMKEDPEPTDGGGPAAAGPADSSGGDAMAACGNGGRGSKSSRSRKPAGSRTPRAAVRRGKAAQARTKARAAVGWPPLERAAAAGDRGHYSDGGGGGGGTPRPCPAGQNGDDDDDKQDEEEEEEDEDEEKDVSGDEGDTADEERASISDGRVVTLEDLHQHFEVPIKDAAKSLGFSLSYFKNVCRRLGVPRWPARKLLTLQKMRGALLLEAAADASSSRDAGGGGGSGGGTDNMKRREREWLLHQVRLNIADIYADASAPMYPEFTRVRQLQYKSRTSARRGCRSRSGSKAADGPAVGGGGAEEGRRPQQRGIGGVAKRRSRRGRGSPGTDEDSGTDSEEVEGTLDDRPTRDMDDKD